MPDNSSSINTEIIIQDFNDGKPVVFSNFVLNESMINVNHFSFSLRPTGEDETTLSVILDFKKKVLGKDVQVTLKEGEADNYKFKGIVLEVDSLLVDNAYYEFKISGSGSFGKVDQTPEYHSFYKKKLDAIVDEAFKPYSLKGSLDKNPQNSNDLHYTVQYNQTAFSFLASLAIRHGEWMYYDGDKLQFGKKPNGNAIALLSPNEVFDLNIKAKAVRTPKSLATTDIFKSVLVEAKTKEEAPGNDLIKAAEDSGKNALEEAPRKSFLSSGFNQKISDDKFKLAQQAIFSSSVYITGKTRNNKLGVGKLLKIKESKNDSGKDYILTSVDHRASNASHYENSFEAIPAEVKVPPYTNPLLVPKAQSQPAIVTDNEDDGGLARVKVRFPWMADDEKSPWISVLTPHSGKDKGFRFLPEKDDEVMVDFWDGNVETPFVNGSLYTDKNKPGIAEKGNNIKMIGSRTGRSLVIDDDAGTFSISDGGNTPGKGKNLIKLSDSDKDRSVKIVSGEDGENHYAAMLNYKEKNSTFYCQVGGTAVLEITFDAEKKQMYLYANDDINIKSDGSINIEAKEDINLKAGKSVNCDTQKDVKIDAVGDLKANGMNVNLKATAGFKAEAGATAKMEGMQTSLKGSLTNIEGTLVKIN